MVTTAILGLIETQNISKYEPFQVEFSEIDSNTIQLDVIGKGVIKYLDKINDELLLEINTNINKELIRYFYQTGHNSSHIGYSFKLTSTKKIDTDYKSLVAYIAASIVFQKPLLATAFQLQPTIELITSTILGQIFILGK